MRYIGLISGTSMDGIDAALVHIDGDGLRLEATHARKYPNALREELLAGAVRPENFSLVQTGRVHGQLAREFAAAVTSLLEVAGLEAGAIRAIGSHGQTLLHEPTGDAPVSLQLGDPGALAALTGISVVADFRSTDLALGGQGAPLMPAFHRFAFGDSSSDRIALNIGGIANLSLLSANGAVRGFDSGPGNTLLDAWHREHQGGDFDRDGTWAASGTVDTLLLDKLLDDPYFLLAPPKSTGTDYFNSDWLQQCLQAVPGERPPADVQATLAALTSRTIIDALKRTGFQPSAVAVCGGGVHNADLMRRLREALGSVPLASTSDWGLDPDWVEAAGFAWLAHERLAARPSSLPDVTGAREAASLGAVYLPVTK